jgi:hypothetical protein
VPEGWQSPPCRKTTSESRHGHQAARSLPQTASCGLQAVPGSEQQGRVGRAVGCVAAAINGNAVALDTHQQATPQCAR